MKLALAGLLVTTGVVLTILYGGTCNVSSPHPDELLTQTSEKYELVTKSFECGEYRSAEVSIPDNATSGFAIASRDGWKDTGKDVIHVKVDVFDGKRWINNYAGFTVGGGDLYDKDGKLYTESVMQFGLVSATNRKARVGADIKEPLTSVISLKFQ
jgi:hypothetical protein